MGTSGDTSLRRYLLDTGTAADYIHRRRGVFLKARESTALGHRIGICVPILGELWSGVYSSASRDRNEKRLLQHLHAFALWPYTEEAAREFGRLSSDLRRVGRPMPQIDIQIAAIAFTLGNCVVVTKDSDFDAIPGLDHEDWS